MKKNGKRTQQIKLLVDDEMLADLKDVAFQADRSVSEYVWHTMRRHLYGHSGMVERLQKKTTDRES